MSSVSRQFLPPAFLLLAMVAGPGPAPGATAAEDGVVSVSGKLSDALHRDVRKVSLTLRDVEISEVMDMLSRRERVNILLAQGVKGEVSVNLYDVELEQAIELIASAAGFAVERRNGSYFIVRHDQAGRYEDGGLTKLRTFKVQYTDASVIRDILKNYLSSYGKITILPGRRLLVIEDTPDFLGRVGKLLHELDREPKQILIEAKILQITLRDSESYGLDWARLFRHDSGEGSIGVRGLSDPSSPGFFFELLTPNIEVFLDTLKERGRLRTLSTPKLLALEDEEAEALVGDRIGYRVTTTINQVTTESIEYLETGVVLRVLPAVDERGRVLLDIHPEVSTGTVSDDGIPSKSTTEVTTRMLVDSGQTVFIGGLLRRSLDQTREGVPLLGDIPGVGLLFSNRAKSSTNTETVVLITPYVVGDTVREWDNNLAGRAARIAQDLERSVESLNTVLGNEGDKKPEENPPRQETAPEAGKTRKNNAWSSVDEFY